MPRTDMFSQVAALPLFVAYRTYLDTEVKEQRRTEMSTDNYRSTAHSFGAYLASVPPLRELIATGGFNNALERFDPPSSVPDVPGSLTSIVVHHGLAHVAGFLAAKGSKSDEQYRSTRGNLKLLYTWLRSIGMTTINPDDFPNRLGRKLYRLPFHERYMRAIGLAASVQQLRRNHFRRFWRFVQQQQKLPYNEDRETLAANAILGPEAAESESAPVVPEVDGTLSVEVAPPEPVSEGAVVIAVDTAPAGAVPPTSPPANPLGQVDQALLDTTIAGALLLHAERLVPVYIANLVKSTMSPEEASGVVLAMREFYAWTNSRGFTNVPLGVIRNSKVRDVNEELAGLPLFIAFAAYQDRMVAALDRSAKMGELHSARVRTYARFVMDRSDVKKAHAARASGFDPVLERFVLIPPPETGEEQLSPPGETNPVAAGPLVEPIEDKPDSLTAQLVLHGLTHVEAFLEGRSSRQSYTGFRQSVVEFYTWLQSHGLGFDPRLVPSKYGKQIQELPLQEMQLDEANPRPAGHYRDQLRQGLRIYWKLALALHALKWDYKKEQGAAKAVRAEGDIPTDVLLTTVTGRLLTDPDNLIAELVKHTATKPWTEHYIRMLGVAVTRFYTWLNTMGRTDVDLTPLQNLKGAPPIEGESLADPPDDEPGGDDPTGELTTDALTDDAGLPRDGQRSEHQLPPPTGAHGEDLTVHPAGEVRAETAGESEDEGTGDSPESPPGPGPPPSDPPLGPLAGLVSRARDRQ